MQIAIQTQVYENYGSAEKPRWKPKSGNTILITDVPRFVDYQALVDNAGSIGVECDNAMYREFIVGWSTEDDDFISNSEKDQLEYEGAIRYRDARIEYSELVEASL